MGATSLPLSAAGHTTPWPQIGLGKLQSREERYAHEPVDSTGRERKGGDTGAVAAYFLSCVLSFPPLIFFWLRRHLLSKTTSTVIHNTTACGNLPCSSGHAQAGGENLPLPWAGVSTLSVSKLHEVEKGVDFPTDASLRSTIRACSGGIQDHQSSLRACTCSS